MSFLNPLYLFGLAAAAIPIIIHLFTRRRPREVPFPSLEFLTEVNQSEIRRLRLKQWLLLLLRTLARVTIALLQPPDQLVFLTADLLEIIIGEPPPP